MSDKSWVIFLAFQKFKRLLIYLSQTIPCEPLESNQQNYSGMRSDGLRAAPTTIRLNKSQATKEVAGLAKRWRKALKNSQTRLKSRMRKQRKRDLFKLNFNKTKTGATKPRPKLKSFLNGLKGHLSSAN